MYERLYQDALDRLIRKENRNNKYQVAQQTELMSVLHLSTQHESIEDPGALSPSQQQKMYHEFYKGFETFERAMHKRMRSNKIIQRSVGGDSPRGSPKRRLFEEEAARTGGKKRDRSQDVRSPSPPQHGASMEEGSSASLIYSGGDPQSHLFSRSLDESQMIPKHSQVGTTTLSRPFSSVMKS